MKYTIKRSILLLLLLFLASFLNGQAGMLDLYLQPDLQSDKVETVEAGDPRLGPGVPVPDEVSASIGWHFADFNGTINGFIPDAKIGKDLFPVNDAIIYAGSSSDSPVIATYQTGDQLEIVDTGAWWEVRLMTVFPVYYIMEPAGTLHVVDTAGFDDVSLLEESAPPAGSGIILSEKPPPKFPDNITSQSYQGIFRKSKKGLGLFTPKAPFYLQDSSGGRMAWVNTEGMVSPGTLDRYLNKPVLIHGEREFDQSKKEWIIHARNMRLK